MMPVVFGRGSEEPSVAEPAAERVGAPFAQIDITTDDALHAAYLERIPVITLDGEEVFELFVDEAALRALLSKVGRG